MRGRPHLPRASIETAPVATPPARGRRRRTKATRQRPGVREAGQRTSDRAERPGRPPHRGPLESHEGASTTLLRVRDVTACPHHRRILVHLEDASASPRLSFYADAEDGRRLARELARGLRACHPIFDFIQVLLQSWHAAPVRVVLEDAHDDGVGALVYLRQGEVESAIPCYPPDALTLALRTGVPIYATPDVLERGRPASRSRADDLYDVRWLEDVRPRDFGR